MGSPEAGFCPEATIQVFTPIADNRTSSATEAREVSSDENVTSYTRDLDEIDKLMAVFNTELGIAGDVRLNYNPVYARWKYAKRMAETTTPELVTKKFRRHERFQVETALRERYRAAKSATNYIIDEETGNVYYDLFPDEPFYDTLLRGLAIAKAEGSLELAREEAEVYEWPVIMDDLKDPNTPAHTKRTTVSGPSTVYDPKYKGKKYPDNFVDIYEALDHPVTGKRYIRMTRNATELTYDKYSAIARRLDPHYFDGYDDTTPIDAWFLGHSIVRSPDVDPRTVDELIDQEFGRREGAISEERFREIFDPDDAENQEEVDYFIDELCAPIFNPKELALRWNAVIKKYDLRKEQLDAPDEVEAVLSRGNTLTPYQVEIYERPPEVTLYPEFASIAERVNWLGRQQIMAVAAACGVSEGFALDQISVAGLTSTLSISEIVQQSMVEYDPLSNSVAKLGLQDFSGASESEWFKCPSCGYQADGPVGDSCPKSKGGCGLTKQAFAKSGGKVC